MEQGKRMIKLSSDQAIMLRAYDADASRFEQQFLNVWKKLPKDVTVEILAVWNQLPSGLFNIELSDLWIDSCEKVGNVSGNGTEVRFSASSFFDMPDDAAMFVIAHELAHVYQSAIEFTGEYEQCEHDADRRAVEWGFKLMALFEWRVRNSLKGVL